MPVKRYDGSNWVTVAGEGVQGPTGPAGASATTVVTTKGDLLTYDTTAARLGIGSNDQVLTADSTAATGLKWATPAAGGMTLLSTTTLSGSSTTISGIATTYKLLKVIVLGAYGTDQNNITMRLNGDTGSNYTSGYSFGAGSVQTYNAQTSAIVGNLYNTSAAIRNMVFSLELPRYNETSGSQLITFNGLLPTPPNGYAGGGIYSNKSAAITSITFLTTAGTFSAGTVYVYGVS
jgi:hypothetical protein